MLNRILLALSSLLAAAALAACTADAPVVTGEVRPAMWEASKGGSRLILLGSVHQLPPELDWTGGRVALAVRQADELLMELSPDDVAGVPAAFARMSRDEPVAPLDRRLGSGSAERARDLLLDVGWDSRDADATESWALALSVGNVLAQRSRLTADNGVETRLTDMFRAAGKPVAGLERAEWQLSLFDDLPPALQDRLLSSSVAQAATATARSHALVRAWAAGDVPAIAAAAQEELDRTPGLAEPLVHARNRAWTAQLLARMERPGTVLVAVGAGHLAGEGSVIDLLQQAGVTVRRIQ